MFINAIFREIQSVYASLTTPQMFTHTCLCTLVRCGRQVCTNIWCVVQELYLDWISLKMVSDRVALRKSPYGPDASRPFRRVPCAP